jgi:hypothetical protein
VFIFLAYLPWLSAMLAQMGSDVHNWIPKPELVPSLKNYFVFLFNSSKILQVAILTLYSFLIIRSLFKIIIEKKYKKPRELLMSSGSLLVQWLILPFVVIFIKSIISAPILINRLLIISLPASYLLLARSITQLPFSTRLQSITACLITGIIMLHLVFHNHYYSKPAKSQYREAIGYVAERDQLYTNSMIAGSYPHVMRYYFLKKGLGKRRILGITDSHLALTKVVKREKPEYLWHISTHNYPNLDIVQSLYNDLDLSLIEHGGFLNVDVWLFQTKYKMKTNLSFINQLSVSYLGFHQPEQWQNKIFRWSRKEGIISIPKHGTIELTYHVSNPDIAEFPVNVHVQLNKKKLDTIVFQKPGFITKQYYIPKKSNTVSQFFIQVSRTWVPSQYGISKDNRDLGVAVSEIRFLDEMPLKR